MYTIENLQREDKGLVSPPIAVVKLHYLVKFLFMFQLKSYRVYLFFLSSHRKFAM